MGVVDGSVAEDEDGVVATAPVVACIVGLESGVRSAGVGVAVFDEGEMINNPSGEIVEAGVEVEDGVMVKRGSVSWTGC